jgi:YD repeat-containing protein
VPRTDCPSSAESDGRGLTSVYDPARQRTEALDSDGGVTSLVKLELLLGTDSMVARNPSCCGKASRVVFEIESFDDYTEVATCLVKYRPCRVSRVNGEDDDKRIEVYDPAGCYFNEAAADVVGRWGHADWMIADEEVEAYPECKWVVSGLCCP